MSPTQGQGLEEVDRPLLGLEGINIFLYQMVDSKSASALQSWGRFKPVDNILSTFVHIDSNIDVLHHSTFISFSLQLTKHI